MRLIDADELYTELAKTDNEYLPYHYYINVCTVLNQVPTINQLCLTAKQKAYIIHALCLELQDVEPEYKPDVMEIMKAVRNLDTK